VHHRELLAKSGNYDDSMPFFIDWDMFQRLAKYAKPHHLNVYTCEHYMYLNKEKKESNTISSAHKRDPELSQRMHFEMFKRSFKLLSAQDFAEFVRDWLDKTYQLEQKDKELHEKEKLLQDSTKKIDQNITSQLSDKDKVIEDKQNIINALHNSLSWRITAPLRWCFDNFYVKFKK
jgi:hypothetical protein